MLHVKNFTRRVRKVHFWHFPTKSRYRQKTCWVNSFQWYVHNENLRGRAMSDLSMSIDRLSASSLAEGRA